MLATWLATCGVEVDPEAVESAAAAVRRLTPAGA
jgi:hypothetical protein